MAGQDVAALGFRGEDGNFSLRVGAIGSGNVLINDRDLRQMTAISFGASYDVSISDYVFFGLSVDFHRMDWERASTQESDKSTMIDVAVGMKYRISVADGLFALRPGLSIGTGFIGSISGLNDARFFTVKGTAEFIYYFSDNLGLLIEGGVFVAPSGSGNDDVNEISIKGLPIFRVGLVF